MVEWGQAWLPLIAVCEGKETAGMGFHLLVLTICELEGSPAYCCRALQRLSCCSGTAQTAGSGSLGLTLQSPASPTHTKGKGYCRTILFCPRASSPQAWDLCCVNRGLTYWPAESDVLIPMTLCLSLKPQWPTIRTGEGPTGLSENRTFECFFLNVKCIKLNLKRKELCTRTVCLNFFNAFVSIQLSKLRLDLAIF